MPLVRVLISDMVNPIFNACVQAYGCMVSVKRKYVYLFTFDNDSIVSWLFTSENVQNKIVKGEF